MKRYLYDSDLETLCSQFVAENMESSFSAFSKNVPFNVIKPKANDWGICLCVYCLNPELKVEALSDLKILPPISLAENTTNEEGLQNIISQLDFLSLFSKNGVKSKANWKDRRFQEKFLALKKTPEFVKLLKNDIFFRKNIRNELNCNIATLRKLAFKSNLVMGRLQLYILTGLKHKNKKVRITLKIKFHYMQCDYVNTEADSEGV